MSKDPFRICALCRHLEMMHEGEQFEGIADTAYAVFKCTKLGWSSRDDYLMDAEPVKRYQPSEPNDCPFWEPHPKGP